MPIEMTCANCSHPFYCYPSEAEQGRKYCSLTCRTRHRFGQELPAAGKALHSFNCKECGKPFTMMQTYLTAYQKKFGKNPLYCSNSCSALGRRKDADERNKFVCEQCGKVEHRNRKPGGRIYQQQKYCSQECKVEAQKHRALDKFNRGDFGRHIKRHGYIWISVPSLVTGKKHGVMEHRYVMSKSLGRDLLSEETVHHIDGNRSNNAPENLELFSSRHGPGQRVVDKVAFAIEILRLYPEFAKAAGVELRDL